MKNVFKTMAFTLLGLVLSVNLMADDPAPLNTVLWGETWTGASTGNSGNDNYTPSANYGKGTTVYNSGSVTYSQSANSVYVRNENTGGGTAPELLLSSGKTWTISNISTCGAVELSLTYVSNNTKSSVTCSTAGVSISGSSKSYTITSTTKDDPLPATIALVFGCTGNTRIDNVELKVSKAGKAGGCTSTLTAPEVVATPGDGQIVLTWGAVTNATAYDIYKNTVKQGSTTETSYTLTDLTNGTSYAWKVVAIGNGTTICDSEPASGSETPNAVYTLNYSIAGVAGSVKATDGSNIVASLPSSPASCSLESNVFQGWTTASSVQADGSDFIPVSGNVDATAASKTYTAVWAKASSEGAAPVNTVLWGENFAHFGTKTPSSAGTGTGTTIYDGASITYDQSSTNTKGYNENSAGGTAPELLLSKSNQTWTISGIKSGAAKKISLTFLSNKTAFSLTCSSDAYTVSGSQKSWTLTLAEGKTAPETFNLTLKNTSSGDNARIDNVELKITEAGITYSDYVTQCCTTHEVKKGTMSIGGFTATPAQACAEAEISLAPDEVTGYNFTGWTSSPIVTITDNKFSMPDEDVTITANYEAISYNITYDLDGGEWNGEAGVATYTYGTGATLPTADDVIKANNEFLGWFLNNTGEEPTIAISTTETGDKSFTARWLASGSKNVTIEGDNMLTYTTFKPTTVDKDAENLEIEYSIEKGYTIVTVTVKVGETELTETEVEFSDSKLTITPDGGFTDDVAIQFMVADKMFTVTWMANKAKFKEEQIKEGSKVTLPAETPSDVISGEDTYKFQGWFTEEQYSNETTAPAYITNNTIEPEGDVTYYAVYAIVTPGPVSNDYAKITATTDLVEDGQYIIASGTKALNSDVYNEHYMTATGVTISNNKITNTNTKLVWTIEDVNGGNVLFKSNGNGNYLQIIQDGTYHNLIAKNNDATNANKSYFTPSVNSGNWTLEANSVEGYYVGYKSGSGYTEFTAVNPSSNLQLYKRQNNPDTYKNYRTRVAIIDHIEVKGTPKETNFVAGETFDATGLTIDVYYKDEVDPINVTSGFTYAPTSALKTTDENITFTYQGKTADVAISVSNTVSGIEVTTNPSKMEYTEGQQFDHAGMVVTATYDNSAERDVTGYTYTPTGDLALSDKITISFGGQTTNLNITINEAQKTTVNWFVEGVKLTEGEQSTAVIPGKKITVLPTEPEACQGNQFVGWTAVDANYYNATTAPTDLFKTLAEVPTIGSETTNFYAVFAQITSTPVAESTVYTSNIDNDKLGDKVNIGDSDDNQVAAIKLGTGSTPASSLSFDVPAGTTTITLHAVAWKDKSNVTITMSTEKAGVVITPSDAQAVSANNGATGNSPFSITPADGDFYTFTLSGVTEETEVTISNATERVVLWGINTATTITSDYSTTCLPALTAPSFTTDEGEYCTSVDVAIAKGDNPEEAKLQYSLDGGTSWTDYSALTLTETKTVKARVILDLKTSDEAEATYIILKHYSDLTVLKATATDQEQRACVSFSNLLVNATNVSTVYLTDGTNTYMIFKNGHGFSRGQKLSTGDHAILPYKLYNGVLQFNDNAGITVSSSDNATPATTMAVDAIAASNYGQLVKIENVIYVADGAYFKDGSDNKIKLGSNIVNASSWVKDGAKYDITGIITTQMIEEVPTLTISPRVKDLDVVSKADKLNAPEELAVSGITGSSATLSWKKVDGAAKYEIEVYKGSERVKQQTTKDGDVTTYTPSLEAGTTYTWRIRSIGNDLTTSTSDWADAEEPFQTLKAAKLVWMVNGEQWGEPTYAVNEKVVMPTGTPTSECSDNYQDFICWILNPIEGVRTEKIYDNMRVSEKTAAKSKTDGSLATYTFYAAFGKVETEGSETYVKVTANQDDWTGDYLIGKETSGTIFDGSRPRTDEALDDTYNIQSITIPEDGTITNVDDVKAYQFSIAKSSTTKDDDGADAVYYTIKSAQNYYIGGKNNDNGMNSNSSFSTKTYDNIITWLTENNRVQISSYYGTTYLTFNNADNQQRFRYMKSEDKTITLYKRVTTPTTYSAYITTCPTFYTITLAGEAGVKDEGIITASKTTEVEKNTVITLSVEAKAGYTATGGTWKITKTSVTPEVDVTADVFNAKKSELTMPDYDVTVDYNFQEKKDQFVDNLHGNTTIERGGANYELPTLVDAEPGEKCDAYYVFAGWVAEEHAADSGEPAQDDSHVLTGKQTATGATYYALWWDYNDYFITECCTTPVPVKRDDLTKVQATSAQIGWYKVDGADKYHVTLVKDGDTKGEGEDLVITDGQYKYVMNGLTVNTSYTVYVKAHISCWGEEQVWNFTTAEEKNSYKVTINAEGGTYTIDPVLVDGKITEGETVTITDIIPNDADHYFFKELTVPEATDLTEITGGYKFTMPGKAVTINIVFAEYPTVTWKMEGAADQTSIAVRNGDKFEIGADNMQSAPENWKYKTYFPEFAGWVTSDKCDADGNVTTAEFITATTEVPADGLTVYGAVAKSAKADMTGTLTKVIANDNIDANAYYIIGADKNGTDNTQYYFIKLGNKWGVMNTVDNEDNQEPMLLKAIATTGGFSLKNLAGSYIDGCSSKTFTMSENASTLSLSTVDADKSAIQYYYSSGNKYWKLRHNYGTAQGIRWYDGTTGVPSYLYKVALAYENLTINPQPDYARTDLVVGNYGTVCVPYVVKTTDRSGATFWNIETSNTPGYTNPTSVTIVEETGNLVAGKPYIFCAEATTMSLFFSGAAYDGGEDYPSNNGLYGNLTEETITINDQNDPNAGPEPTRGFFFVLQQKLYECGWNCTVAPNRGWVQAADIQNMTTPSPAPRRVIGNPNGTPTGIHNLNADGFKNIEGARKYFHNNNIVIVNEGRIYNAQGILIQ